MKVFVTSIPDVLIFEPQVFGDDRGFFMESFNARKFSELAGIEQNFVQDNHSRSKKGVLRGLHYQMENAQGKLVRVTSGEIFDVAVDIRRQSSTFGKWVGVKLSADNKRMLWVPKGFAHGFLTLSEVADCLYKVTNYYEPDHERSILWNDPEIGIEWPIDIMPVLSIKDREGVILKNAETFL